MVLVSCIPVESDFGENEVAITGGLLGLGLGDDETDHDVMPPLINSLLEDEKERDMLQSAMRANIPRLIEAAEYLLMTYADETVPITSLFLLTQMWYKARAWVLPQMQRIDYGAWQKATLRRLMQASEEAAKSDDSERKRAIDLATLAFIRSGFSLQDERVHRLWMDLSEQVMGLKPSIVRRVAVDAGDRDPSVPFYRAVHSVHGMMPAEEAVMLHIGGLNAVRIDDLAMLNTCVPSERTRQYFQAATVLFSVSSENKDKREQIERLLACDGNWQQGDYGNVLQLRGAPPDAWYAELERLIAHNVPPVMWPPRIRGTYLLLCSDAQHPSTPVLEWKALLDARPVVERHLSLRNCYQQALIRRYLLQYGLGDKILAAAQQLFETLPRAERERLSQAIQQRGGFPSSAATFTNRLSAFATGQTPADDDTPELGQVLLPPFLFYVKQAGFTMPLHKVVTSEIGEALSHLYQQQHCSERGASSPVCVLLEGVRPPSSRQQC